MPLKRKAAPAPEPAKKQLKGTTIKRPTPTAPKKQLRSKATGQAAPKTRPNTPPARKETQAEREHRLWQARMPKKPVYEPITGKLGLTRKDGTNRVPFAKLPKHPALKPIRCPSKSLLSSTIAIIRDGKLEAYRTTASDGIAVTWDRCSECAGHIALCRCRAYTMPKSVWYVPDLKAA